MQPLELIQLPQNIKMISTYIDGRIVKLKNAPFIEGHILYAPIIELSEYWNYEIEVLKDRIKISKGIIIHEFLDTAVYDVKNEERKKLDYHIVSIDHPISFHFYKFH